MIRFIKMKREARFIQKIEAELFVKTMNAFHRSMSGGDHKPIDFWNKFSDIRLEYIEKLEQF